MYNMAAMHRKDNKTEFLISLLTNTEAGDRVTKLSQLHGGVAAVFCNSEVH